VKAWAMEQEHEKRKKEKRKESVHANGIDPQ